MGLIEVGIGIVLRHTPNKITTQATSPRGTTGGSYELLITRRPHDTVFGGYWELPGGKADPGETPDDCVRRELFEEVGVQVRVIGRLSEVTHTYPHGTVRLHPRLCVMLPHSPPPANLHVAEHRWCPVNRLDEHEFPPANEGIVRELRDTLAQGVSLD